MDRRRDALLGAARLVEAVNRIGLGHPPHACTTVGMLDAYPNSRNVIPGRVFLTIDVRHPDDGVLASMDTALRARLDAIADALGLAAEIRQILDSPAVVFDVTRSEEH